MDLSLLDAVVCYAAWLTSIDRIHEGIALARTDLRASPESRNRWLIAYEPRGELSTD